MITESSCHTLLYAHARVSTLVYIAPTYRAVEKSARESTTQCDSLPASEGVASETTQLANYRNPRCACAPRVNKLRDLISGPDLRFQNFRARSARALVILNPPPPPISKILGTPLV